MSRSYKKSPVWTDGRGGRKKAKRIANRYVRRNWGDLPTRARKAYRKYYCSYNIHDWICYWTETEAYYTWKESWIYQREYPTFEEYFNKEYARSFIRK